MVERPPIVKLNRHTGSDKNDRECRNKFRKLTSEACARPTKAFSGSGSTNLVFEKYTGT
jgi:hypothetical protein